MANVPDDAQDRAAQLTRLDQLRQAERRAASARMVAVIGHVIGTPLNVIVGRAGLLRTNTSPEAIDENVRRIEEQVERLSQRIRRLIDYFGLADPPEAREPLSAVLAECTTLYGPIAELKGVKLELSPGGNEAAQVDASVVPLLVTTLLSLGISTGSPGSVLSLAVSEQGPKSLLFELTLPGLTPPPGRLDRMEPPDHGVRYDPGLLETLWLCLGLARRIGAGLEVAVSADGLGTTARFECTHA
jgi:signal transduction histidine kinase